MILTKSQAQAVYSAMVVLDNVAARLSTELPCMSGPYRIKVFDNGLGVFVQIIDWTLSENYPTHTAFAEAYGLLKEDRPESECPNGNDFDL